MFGRACFILYSRTTHTHKFQPKSNELLINQWTENKNRNRKLKQKQNTERINRNEWKLSNWQNILRFLNFVFICSAAFMWTYERQITSELRLFHCVIYIFSTRADMKTVSWKSHKKRKKEEYEKKNGRAKLLMTMFQFGVCRSFLLFSHSKFTSAHRTHTHAFAQIN